LLRAHLTIAAEQIILRALAKSREDRYARAQDFAAAFRAAVQFTLSTSEPQPKIFQMFTPRGLLDPTPHTRTLPAIGRDPSETGAMQAASTRTSGLLSRTGMFPSVGTPGTVLPGNSGM